MLRVIRSLSVVAVIVPAALLGACSSRPAPAPHSLAATDAVSPAPPVPLRPAVARLPLAFEPNVGQAPADVRYVTHAAGHRLWLGADEARFVAGRGPAGADVDADAIRIRWIGGSRAATVAGADEQPGKLHYYTGRAPGAGDRKSVV